MIEISSKDLFLFFDSETTGKPRDYKSPVSDFTNWPRLVQLAFILGDVSGRVILMQNYIIKPINFVIPAEATAIHGITTERALEEGLFLQDALARFGWAASIVGNFVCHNFNFDSKVVGCELLRCGRDDVFAMKKSWCTMDETKEFVGVRNSFGFKFPKLQELHVKLFNQTFDEAHDALHDIMATFRCFYDLRKRGVMKDR